MVEFSTVKIEFICRFCKNEEILEITYFPELDTEDEAIARHKLYRGDFVCDRCKRIIKEIITDAL